MKDVFEAHRDLKVTATKSKVKNQYLLHYFVGFLFSHIMRVRSVLSLSILLLFVAAFQSCKSPNAPATPPPNPVLSLSLPDSARVFDTVTFRAHYSDSIHTTWKFAWQFGDSGKASTKDTSISHVYDSAGTYTVMVSLVDSSGKTIAKQTGQIKIMPFNGPTLTLTVPDTNYWGDSCVMSISSSQPLKAGWKYSWSLGDSTTVIGADSVLHYYLAPGIYKVMVNLNDTVHHILLASRTVTVPVVARHFNLALLQSMKYVDLTWLAEVVSQTTGPGPYSCLDTIRGTKPILWNGLAFSIDSADTISLSTGKNDTYGLTTSFLVAGSVDSNLSECVSFGTDTITNSYQTTWSQYTNCNTEINFGIQNVMFVSQSDTEVIFRASSKYLINPYYEFSFSNSVFTEGGGSINSQTDGSANWSSLPNTYVLIRFHK
jgi:hypothetical protein